MNSWMEANGVLARWRPIGSTIAVTSASERPLPPKRSGTAMLGQPRSTISPHSSRSKPDSEAICRRTSVMESFSRQKLVAMSSSIFCSSLKVILLLSEAIELILRQAEHALANNVGLDLAGAAADRRRERVEIGTLPFAAVDRLVIADI